MVRRPSARTLVRTALTTTVAGSLAASALLATPAVAAPARGPADAAATAALPGPVLRPSLREHLAAVAAGTPVRVLVQAGGVATDARSAVAAAGLRPEVALDAVGIVAATGTPAQVRALAADPRVTRLDWADEELRLLSETSHEATRAVEVHRGIVDVDGDPALDGLLGTGTSVAVVDSGTDGTHPMFAAADGTSRVRKNVKIACSDAAPILLGGTREDYGTADSCAVDATAVNDTDTPSVGGHGTHVTGIAAGGVVTDRAGRELRGAAPGADVVAVSAGATLSIYGGTLGLYWVLEHHADPCGDGSCPPIVVVNNSWGPSGGGGFDPTDPQVLVQRALVEAGVTVVWAAGNDGGDGTAAATNPYSVDPTPGVLSVANYDDADQGSRDNDLDASSSRGQAGDVATYPDLAAPGTNITSACRPYLPVCATGLDTADPDYNTITGTSMAAPHVAGYVAVLQEAALRDRGRRLTPAEVEDLLLDTAHRFGTRTYQPDTRNPDSTTGTSFDAGHGLVDLAAAAGRLTGSTVPPVGGAACPVDAAYTDPEGDATGVLGVPTPLPNAAGLDVTRAWLTSDRTTSDVTFHVQVSDLAEAPGGLEGTGEYFDLNFTFGGAGYYLGASRAAEDQAETFVLGRIETQRQTLRTGLPGRFDAATDTITATLPAQVWRDLGLPGAIRAGEQVSGLEVVARRSLVALVPDADTASGGCAYTIGAEHPTPAPATGQRPNRAPVVDRVRVRAGKAGARVGTPVRFRAAARDADGDRLTYRWSFGDGDRARGAAARHRYDAPGRYRVVLRVTDGRATAVEKRWLRVRPRR